MKKTIVSMIIVAGLFSACNPKGDEAQTGEKQEVIAATGAVYAIDTMSSIKWKGSKGLPMPGEHTGYLKLKDGSLSVENGNITGGNFTIDINSLSNEDMAADAESQGKLVGHMKSPDFFDAGKFPTAKFEITGVSVADSAAMASMKEATHVISGNLTLKDSTKNISFPARVSMDSVTITALADFNIDRTLWGMNYKGPNNPADFVISKQVNLNLMITAKKQ